VIKGIAERSSIIILSRPTGLREDAAIIGDHPPQPRIMAISGN